MQILQLLPCPYLGLIKSKSREEFKYSKHKNSAMEIAS